MAAGARPKCYSTAPGTVDRSATTVKLASRSWLSAQLATTVLDIVLREFLGYSVELVTDSLSTAYWGQSTALGEFDVDLEQWNVHPGSPDYQKYVVKEGTAEILGPIGYPGRSGLFVNKRLQDLKPLSDYFKFWQSGGEFAEASVAGFGDLDLPAWLGEDFPFCSSWCPKGLLEGYWAPPQCQAQPEACALLLHPTPNYDMGYFEQLVTNHNLSAVVAYAGWDSPRLVQRLVDEGKNLLFYWWEPDPLLPLVQAERVAFPDWEYGCMAGATKDPFGDLWCDYPEKLMPKVARRALRKEAPEAYFALKAMDMSAVDIERLMASTTTGGGSLDVFEAACSYVKAKEDSVVAAMAPPCISAPKPTPGPGDLVFDPMLLTCRAMVAEDRMKSCLPQVEGTVDRKSSLVRIAVRDWSSHTLASSVLQILLRDYLRYSVQLVNASKPAADWLQDMEAGDFDVDVERWYSEESASSMTFEMHHGHSVDYGLLGYVGRSSVYVLPQTLAKSRYADYWRFYAGHRGGTDFFTFADLDLRAMLGADFPLCSRDTYGWCGSGRFEGMYAPPACLSSPDDCAVVFSASPDVDTGYFEQLSNNLGLKLVHAYVGREKLGDLVRHVAFNGTKDLLFHWFEPDPLPPSVRAVRVSFPDFSHGCARGDTQDPRDGTVACDAQPQPLVKLVRSSLRQNLPEAAFLLGRFSLTADDMRAMQRELAIAEARGWGREPSSVACEWVRNNFERLREDVAPDCLARPKTGRDLRIGDWVFDSEEGTCRQVSCLPEEVLLAVGDATVCQACGEGQLPNAEQTFCMPCPAGSAPEAQESGKLECVCMSGMRHVLQHGKRECQACPEGRALLAGTQSCSNCSAGRYSAGQGNTVCLLCPRGTSGAQEGQASCASCPQGSYQHAEGATACEECGLSLSTRILGAEDAGQCICRQDFYRQNASSPCVVCPEGMHCPIGSDLDNFRAWNGTRSTPMPPFPMAQVGFMSLSSTPLSVYACSGSERCPGGPPGTCAGNLQPDVQSCSRCRQDFFWDGSHCKSCPEYESSYFFFPLLPLLGCPVLVGLLYRGSRDDIDKWGSWRNCMATMALLILNHCQLASIVGHADMMYTSVLASSMQFSYIFEDPTFLFNPQCVGFTSFRSTMLLRTSLPLVLLVVVVATHCLSHAIAGMGGKGWSGFDRDRSANVYFSLIFTFFVSLSSLALTTFKCASNPNGKATLLADRSVHCYEHAWALLSAIASMAITCVLGFGALFIWATYTAPMRFHEQGFRRRWKFLFIKFRPDVWYWALLFCLRGVLANVGFIFMRSGFFQIYWVMLVVVVYTFSLVTFAPWRHMQANTLDIYSCLALVSMISLLAFNIVHAPAEVVGELQVRVDWTAIALIASPTLVAGALLSRAVRSQVLQSAKACQERELRALCKPLKDLAELNEDEILQLLQFMDDWGRWHIVSTMRLMGAELSGLKDQLQYRLTTGSLRSNLEASGTAMQLVQSISGWAKTVSLENGAVSTTASTARSEDEISSFRAESSAAMETLASIVEREEIEREQEDDEELASIERHLPLSAVSLPPARPFAGREEDEHELASLESGLSACTDSLDLTMPCHSTCSHSSWRRSLPAPLPG